jgi:ABC-type antimicrobial peptide transport system permease subunit
MLRIAWSQALRRWTRSAAVVLAIVVAATSFALLTSAVASSKLEVQGTVDENYQSAYDILVRPAKVSTPLERSWGLVQENYLAGLSGGITMERRHQVQTTPGVEVAAPVAMIGYTLAAVHLTIPLKPYLTGGTDQLFAIKPSWTTDRGLSQLPDRQTYLYFTRRPAKYHNGQYGPTLIDATTGRPIAPCQRWLDQAKPPRSAFDLERRVDLVCETSNPPRGPANLIFYYQMPMLIAAIDPVQEAKLVGLDDAVVQGRYLTAEDQTEIQKVEGGAKTLVPALMAKQPLTDDSLSIQVQRIEVPDPTQLPQELSKPRTATWLTGLPGTTVKTITSDDQASYPRLLQVYQSDQTNTQVQYFRPSPSRYRQAPNGDLAPEPQPPVPPETYFNKYFGEYYAPQPSRDVGFRQLTVHEATANLVNNVAVNPTLQAVGVFDPTKILGFSELSKVPLTTYYPPDAAPADAASRRALGGRSLLPNANLTGYLQQPPTILTTIKSLPAFLGSDAYPDVSDQERTAPISVIRVRVAGVTGADDASRERVRLAAEQIARETGLTVDITAGTSPTPQTIDLAAGDFGRPELRLTEGWVKKGVSVLLLDSIDTKSLALFFLVLVVCMLFLSNATVAAVRTRRSELGVLACVGWSAPRIFALLEVELLLTGLVAGLLGTGLAAALALTFGLQLTWWHVALITPVATALAALAGIWPAWKASHTTPVEAIQPAVRLPRRARNVDTVTKLAWVGVRRLPGRTALGAVALFVGVAALAVLVAVQQAFQGRVTGTALGNAVAVQVRGVDYLAAAITIGLGAFAVADICYLNISERAAEIGTLRSTGWSEGHLRRLFGTEAFITAALGAVSGAAIGVGAAAALLPIGLTITITAAVLAAGGGILAAMLAVAAPLSRLQQLAPATTIE